MKIKRISALLIMGLLSACVQSAGLYVANIANKPSQFSATTNIAYGSEPWQKLDVYTPTKSGDAPHPTILFFYGGGWSNGTKEQYQFVANLFVQYGYAVVLPDYSKYPPSKYPSFVEDAALASKWVSEHLSEYGGDVGKLHLAGHSAGAHIGAMLLADKHFLAAQGLSPNMFRSFVGLSGPYDFTPTAKKFQKIFGPPENYSAMQASHFIDGTEPPMLLIHGEDDGIVGRSNAEKLSAAIEKAGGEVKLHDYKNLGHFGVMAVFSDTLPGNSDLVRDMLHFLSQHSTP